MTTTPAATDDGKILGDALLGVPPEVLATAISMMRETRLLPVMWSRVKTLIRWTDDDFQNELAASARELATHPAGELALDLVLELNQTLDIKPRNYAARRDVDDNATEIIQESVTALKNADKEFSGDGLQDLVVYQVQKLVTGIGSKLDDLSEEERQAIVSEFRKFIEGLPEDQQAAIKRELGADDLSDSLIRSALASGAAATAFAAVVEVAGFSAYTFATSSLAAVSGVIGLTLPFTAYTGLTSLIAVLASPWFILLLMGGGGYFAYSRGESKLRRGLAPLVVTQLATAGAVGEPHVDRKQTTSEFLTRWRDAVNRCRAARARLEEFRYELKSETESLKEVNSAINATQIEIKGQDDLKSRRLVELAGLLNVKSKELASGKWHGDLASSGRDLVEAQEHLEEIVRDPVGGGLGFPVKAIHKGLRERRARSHVEAVAGNAAVTVLEHHSRGLSIPDTDVTQILGQMADCDRELTRLQAELNRYGEERKRLEEVCRDLTAKAAEASRAKSDSESMYWGLEQVR